MENAYYFKLASAVTLTRNARAQLQKTVIANRLSSLTTTLVCVTKTKKLPDGNEVFLPENKLVLVQLDLPNVPKDACFYLGDGFVVFYTFPQERDAPTTIDCVDKKFVLL